MRLEIVEHSGELSQDLREEFCDLISYKLTNGGPFRELKFQRNLYYQSIAAGTFPDTGVETPAKALRADYVAFILWED